MTPADSGRVATILPGVRPSILWASSPTASTLLVFLSMDITEGSFNTIPLPLIYTSTLAVPKSMPISLNPNKSNLTFPYNIKMIQAVTHTSQQYILNNILLFYKIRNNPFLYKEKHDLPAKSSCIRHVYPAFDSYSVRFIRFHTTCFSGKYMMLRELSVLIST